MVNVVTNINVCVFSQYTVSHKRLNLKHTLHTVCQSFIFVLATEVQKGKFRFFGA